LIIAIFILHETGYRPKKTSVPISGTEAFVIIFPTARQQHLKTPGTALPKFLIIMASSCNHV
jgi:hypothetical protein